MKITYKDVRREQGRNMCSGENTSLKEQAKDRDKEVRYVFKQEYGLEGESHNVYLFLIKL